jgi:hypothetical protein
MCILCPPGSICPQVNMSIPIAKYGYWRSTDNINTYYQCTPEESCGGGGAENCTLGYSGPRCGFCSRNYYRFRRNCNKCEEGAWLRLVGLLALMALVTGVFFLLSSTKVHHIASIAIAFSFWQVISMFAKFDIKWPALIGSSLTGASTANFNVDFLSPNCVFPEMDYVSLWTLQMMMPVAFFICFAALYFILLMRSFFASITKYLLSFTFQIVYFAPPSTKEKYNIYDDSDEEEKEKEEKNVSKSKKVVKFLLKVLTKVKNFFLSILRNIANFTIWWFTEKSSSREMMKIFNRIINSVFAFLSFTFIFIMTTASEVFVCKLQPNGLYTLSTSPNIFCYQPGVWWYMFPLTIVWYIVFGGGSFVYFVLVYFKYKDWTKSTNFNERNKFMLSRFRNKLFFWEAVITLRKTILSILNIFLDPMLVIVCGIFLMFVGFLLHTNFVPFKRKFHNVMDYFVIIVTMTSLFFGLLFFVDKFPDQLTKDFVEYIAFFVLLGSTIIVVGMILWDARTRKKHDQKKKKLLKLHKNKDKERDFDRIKVIFDIHRLDESYDKTYKSDNHQNIFGNHEVPWDVEYDYKPMNFKTDSSSNEDGYTHMNQVFGDLFSKERFKKTFFSFEKKGIRTGFKVVQKIQKIANRNTIIKEKEIKTYDDVKKVEEEIKDKIRASSRPLFKSSVDVSSSDLLRRESSIRLIPTKKIGERSFAEVPSTNLMPNVVTKQVPRKSVMKDFNEIEIKIETVDSPTVKKDTMVEQTVTLETPSETKPKEEVRTPRKMKIKDSNSIIEEQMGNEKRRTRFKGALKKKNPNEEEEK